MKVMVIAPHPDDETLGCGGTLLRHLKNGDELYWVIITKVGPNLGWDEDFVKKRESEIDQVGIKYNFKRVFKLSFPAARISSSSMPELINNFEKIQKKVKPETIYIPYYCDVHTDHQFISKAIQSSIKWFRNNHIQKVLMYETISETEFNFINENQFKPNVFVDISNYVEQKIKIMKIYKSEIEDFPFPRSEKTLRSLMSLRGSQSGYNAAEAFQLVYERF